MIVDMTANSGGIEVDESAGTNGESIGPDCPIVVSRPAMHHRWDLLTFLHWRYDPAVVQRLLPPGLTVQTFDGSAWVGLVPFMMQVRGPIGPELLRENGFTVAAFALTETAMTLDELSADPPERLALVLGTEGDGLTRHTIAAADLAVRIPMAGGVDSLNVAAACAVALWALRPSAIGASGAATV